MTSFWFALAVLLPVACTATAQAPPAERPPVIDMHVHAGHSTSSQTWEGLLSDLDAYNVIHAMLSV